MNFNIQVFILQLILTLILFVIIYNITKVYKAIKLEKKISRYSIDSIDPSYVSIFDKLYFSYKKLVKKISRSLSKSVVIKNSSKKYVKYIKYDNNDIEPIDYISNKLLVIICLIIIVIIFDIFQTKGVSLIQLFVVFIIGYFSVDMYLFINSILEKKHTSDDMLKVVIIMNSAFKSGRTVMQGVMIVKDELSGPIGLEFNRIYTDLSFGLSIDEAFTRFSNRIDDDDARYIASSLTVLNKTGGDIVKVFSSIEKSFFTRRKLKNELKSLTAQASLMFRALVIAPIIIFLIILVLSPSYFTPLINTTIGLIILGVIILIYIAYIIIIKKIMKIDI